MTKKVVNSAEGRPTRLLKPTQMETLTKLKKTATEIDNSRDIASKVSKIHLWLRMTLATSRIVEQLLLLTPMILSHLDEKVSSSTAIIQSCKTSLVMLIQAHHLRSSRQLSTTTTILHRSLIHGLIVLLTSTQISTLKKNYQPMTSIGCFSIRENTLRKNLK